MITAREDFLHRVVAQSKGPFKLAVKDIMSTPLFTINREILVDDEIMLMKGKEYCSVSCISMLVSTRNCVFEKAYRYIQDDINSISA